MLTNIQIQKAKATDKPIKLYDAHQLFLFVTPAGAKSWRMNYKLNGRNKSITLGLYPMISLSEAREKAQEARKLVAQGTDPAQAKKAAKAIKPTFEELGREWLALMKPQWTPGYYADNVERLESNIFPYVGSRPIDEITTLEMKQVIMRMVARGRVDLSHRVKNQCSSIFKLAINSGLRNDHPTLYLGDTLPKKVVKHRAAIIDPAEVGPLMRKLKIWKRPITRIALQLIAHTFVRSKELRFAKWEHIDFDDAIWMVPAENLKQRRVHLVPLSTQSLDLLAELKTHTGDHQSGLICPGVRSGKPLSDATLLAVLRDLGFEKDEMCVHGFRSMASTNLNDGLGFDEKLFDKDWIEMQLSHKDRDAVREIYNRAKYLNPRRTMMQGWSNWLEDMENGKKPQKGRYTNPTKQAKEPDVKVRKKAKVINIADADRFAA